MGNEGEMPEQSVSDGKLEVNFIYKQYTCFIDYFMSFVPNLKWLMSLGGWYFIVVSYREAAGGTCGALPLHTNIAA